MDVTFFGGFISWYPAAVVKINAAVTQSFLVPPCSRCLSDKMPIIGVAIVIITLLIKNADAICWKLRPKYFAYTSDKIVPRGSTQKDAPPAERL